MSNSVQASIDLSRRFFVWWTEELAGLVPAWLRRWATQAPRGVIVSAEGSSFVCYDEGRAGLVRRGELTIARGAIDSGARLLRDRIRGRAVVRVPHKACLVRRLELPAAAKRDFDKILQIDLERATPFLWRDVYSDYFIDGETGPDGKVPVCQVIVKRQVLDAILSELQANGISAEAADCWNEAANQGLPIDFLRGQDQTRISSIRRRAKMIVSLSILAVLLSFSAVYIGLSKFEAALERAEAEATAARTKALAVNRSMSATGAALTEVAELRRLKTARPMMLEVLDELTRRLPDSVWVSQMKLDGDVAEVTIVTRSADGLLSMLANSPLFATAEFSAPVTYDPAGQFERALVRINLRPAATRDRGMKKTEGRG
jgi:general secretion pathway protein L